MKLRLHPFAHERNFRSANDFARLADEQQAKFEAIREHSQNAYEWWARSIAAAWKSAASTARQDGDEEAVQQTLNSLPVFLHDSPLARVLSDMTRLGKAQAAQEILPFLTGSQDNTSGRSLTVSQINAHAAFIAALTLETISRKGQETTSFEALIREHEARLGSMLTSDEAEMQTKRAQFDELLSTFRTRFEEIDNGETERFRKLGSQLTTDIGEWRALWTETYDAFIGQLATETAVKLWSARSVAHETRYRAFRKWTIGFGLAGLAITIVWIFAGFAFARWVFPEDSTAQLASYTAGSLALFTLFVWGLRVLIRSMMSEDHLSTDASARSALAHTYLALTKEQAATPEDRAIILASLFAPVSDGLVRDDGMPAFSPASMAAQVLTNPR